MIVFLIIILLILINIIILLSTIEFEVRKCNINNLSNQKNKEIEISISICFLGKIKIFRLILDEQKTYKFIYKIKIKLEKQIKSMKSKTFAKIKSILKQNNQHYLKKLKLESKKFYLTLDIGTKKIFTTIFLIPAISTIISIFLANSIEKINIEKTEYEIRPIFGNKTLYNIKLNCIFSAKIVNIIYVIFLLKKGKKESDKCGRSSNRKLNANCNV